MNDSKAEARERVREIASEHYKRGDVMGWFEALYKESAGNNEMIPWADLEPNLYFRTWAEDTGLKGHGRSALVVGCGLGDDARYLDDLGFRVTAFDISPTAIEWARRLHADRDIEFVVADLFDTPDLWKYSPAGNLRSSCGFDFVLEIYTIQPLPISIREQVIDSIAAFTRPNGTLVVVTRGRGDDDETDELPWPMSRTDLSRFECNGFIETDFRVMAGEEGEPDRFVVEYRRKLEHLIRTPDEMFEFGGKLAGSLSAGTSVSLFGGLGAGKTLLTKGIMNGLGYEVDEVTSPSFTLVNLYKTERFNVYHIDLWRIDAALNVAEAVGLDEIFDDPKAVVIIEWADRLGATTLPGVEIRIEGDGDEPRRVTVNAETRLQKPARSKGSRDY